MEGGSGHAAAPRTATCCTATARRLSFGQLATKAATLTPPAEAKLKSPKDFTLIGRPVHRIDGRAKVTGQAKFGIDAKVPGMLTAVIARPPVFGGVVKSFNADKAKAIPGVKRVVQIDTGIAVLADGFWPAKLGRDALEITWDDGPLATLDTVTQGKQYEELARLEGSAAAVAAARGNVASALATAEKKLEAVYELPYLAHATMEPLNCLAHVRPDGVEIWVGTQMQTTDQVAAAEIAGVKPEQVVIHTMFLGGGFGRRANPAADFVKEAVKVSKAAGVPVKVIWTREDDMRGGYYRPRTYNVIRAGLDANGLPVAWQHRIVGQSIIQGTPFEPMLLKAELDMTQVEGSADMHYQIPNFLVEYKMAPGGVPVLWWRSVGHSFTAFVKECFIDECAAATKQDPVAYRRLLLIDHPRVRGVMDLAAERAGWGRKLPAGHAMGIAVHESFGSLVAQVAEVSVSPAGEVTVHRVVCAVDCGPDRQSGYRPRADGIRHRLRALGRSVRPHHVQGRTGRAEQLPRLPDPAHGRDAEDRGLSGGEQRAHGGRRRTGHSAHRARGRQRRSSLRPASGFAASRSIRTSSRRNAVRRNGFLRAASAARSNAA